MSLFSLILRTLRRLAVENEYFSKFKAVAEILIQINENVY